MKMEFIEVVTTLPSKEKAEEIGRLVIGRCLAACAQISGPVESIYWWNKKMETGREWVLTLKTKRALYREVETLIRKVHPYRVPQIIALPIIEGYSEYLKWIEEEVK